jgi:hypothetical protein
VAKARVSITLILKSGHTEKDITTPNDGDCDHARRVLEAAESLLGLRADDVTDEKAGPQQVEVGRQKVRN